MIKIVTVLVNGDGDNGGNCRDNCGGGSLQETVEAERWWWSNVCGYWSQ